MNEEQIRRLLESLPREKASVGFTEKVMTRLETARRPLSVPSRFAFLAAAVVLAAVWIGTGRWQARLEESRTLRKIGALKAEIENLEKDIRLLREMAPVFYLGGDEKVDLVIDLSRMANDGERWEQQPVNHEASRPETNH